MFCPLLNDNKKPWSVIWYMACIWTPTWQDRIVLWGWEWYSQHCHGWPVGSAKLSAPLRLQAANCPGKTSTRSFLVSECLKMMTEWMRKILKVSIFSSTVWISVLVPVSGVNFPMHRHIKDILHLSVSSRYSGNFWEQWMRWGKRPNLTLVRPWQDSD